MPEWLDEIRARVEAEIDAGIARLEVDAVELPEMIAYGDIGNPNRHILPARAIAQGQLEFAKQQREKYRA